MRFVLEKFGIVTLMIKIFKILYLFLPVADFYLFIQYLY